MSKGLIPGLAFFMIIGLLIILSTALFFIFFKVHVTSIAVDVDSINRYQEVPTILLGSSIFSDEFVVNPDLGGDIRDRSTINCFNGNGPAGNHSPNFDLCTKYLAFFFDKKIETLGKDIPEKEKPDEAKDVNTLDDFKNGLRLSLPVNCYQVTLKYEEHEDILTVEETRGKARYQRDSDCDINSPKLEETYPIPVFSEGKPVIADQIVTIGSSFSRGEEILVNWPEYRTCLSFQEDCDIEVTDNNE